MPDAQSVGRQVFHDSVPVPTAEFRPHRFQLIFCTATLASAHVTTISFGFTTFLPTQLITTVSLAFTACAEVARPTLAVAEELGKRAGDAGRSPLTTLVEVNVGGEAQKSGCSPEELGSVLAAVERAPGLALSGLMTVPPHTDDPAGARPFFDRLVALRDAHGGAARLPELSMGMTHDLEHAIFAGATWVRVGTAIFGERG